MIFALINHLNAHFAEQETDEKAICNFCYKQT